MYFLFLIALLSVASLNSPMATSWGLTLTIVAILPMILHIAINMFTKKMRYGVEAVLVLIFAIIVILFKWAVEQDYLKKVLLLLVIPMLMSICFENLTRKELSLLFRLVIIFFIVECGLSIVEWRLNHNFFYEGNEYWLDLGFFRSTSLLGHPLTNGQVVAVFMTFIAVSDFKNKYFQIFLFFLGYVSLFCFNTRGATIVVTALTVPYFIWKINKTTQQGEKWIIYLGVFCMLSGLVYLVTQTQLGGRLLGMELMDSSGQTRLDVFDFHKHYKHQEDFMWGHPDNYEYVMDRLGAGGIENGIVTMILDFGIIFTIPILLFLIAFQYCKLCVYPPFARWLLLAVFFLISCMNPNLTDPVQWTMWVFAYYAFRPEPASLELLENEAESEDSEWEMEELISGDPSVK